MAMNFREALAVLFRGLSIVLFRAGVIAAGGFMIIIAFGMLLFTFRLAGGVSRGAAISITAFFALAVAAGGLAWQRFFLYRLRAVMLLLFSGQSLPAFPLAAARREVKNHFKNHSQWQALNHWLRRTLSESGPATGQVVWFPVVGSLSQAVLVLAFSRDKGDIGQSAREGAALFLGCENGSRRLALRWLWLSLLGFLILFLCLALPNWFFFSSAGAPVWIGFTLAAIIAWVLHQAFVVPFVLAGMSAALLADCKDKNPDRDLCEKLSPLDPARASQA